MPIRLIHVGRFLLYGNPWKVMFILSGQTYTYNKQQEVQRNTPIQYLFPKVIGFDPPPSVI